MLDHFFEIEWNVPASGYEWRDGRLYDDLLGGKGSPRASLEATRILVPVDGFKQGCKEPPGRTYRPLAKETGLFRDLGALGVGSAWMRERSGANETSPSESSALASEAEILAFAQKYGDLGDRLWALPVEFKGQISASQMQIAKALAAGGDVVSGPFELAAPFLDAPTMYKSGAFFGESLQLWQMHIGFLKSYSELWIACQNHDKEFLGCWIDIRNKGKLPGVPLESPATIPGLFSGAIEIIQESARRRRSVYWIARHLVADQISRRLSGSILPAVVEDTERHRSELRFRPKNLITALWSQFALAFNEDKDFVQCGACGRTIELTPDVARTNRRYCSVRCRVKAHRHRQKRAIKLRADGAPLRQIAKELGADTATVKKWTKVGEK